MRRPRVAVRAAGFILVTAMTIVGLAPPVSAETRTVGLSFTEGSFTCTITARTNYFKYYCTVTDGDADGYGVYVAYGGDKIGAFDFYGRRLTGDVGPAGTTKHFYGEEVPGGSFRSYSFSLCLDRRHALDPCSGQSRSVPV